MVKLLDYEFEFVQHLEPVLDRNGKILEVRPQDRYHQKENKPLHAYGDGTFCRFSISPRWSGVSGVYAFYVNEQLVYVGQCLDFASRFNTGYGSISPRACFAGGQSTNCKINQMVLAETKAGLQIYLYFHMTHNYHVVEKDIILHYQPELNKMLKHEQPSFSMSRKTSVKYHGSGSKAPMKNGRNPSTDDVRKNLLNLIMEARKRGEKELIIQSGVIHKEMGIVNAMPTVCAGMRSIGRLHRHDIIESPPKGNGSRLIYRFYL